MKSGKELEQLADRVHVANKRWWEDPSTGEPIERNVGEMLMLAVSELSEAMEGARRDLMDDHLSYRRMEEVEMADCLIRLLDFSAGTGLGFNERETIVGYPFGSNKGEALLAITEQIVRAYSRWLDSAEAARYHLGKAIVFIQSYCNKHDLDLWGAFEDKLAYNAQRRDHTNEARLQPGGKKW